MVNDKRSRVYIINESMVVDFVEAAIGEGCRWRGGIVNLEKYQLYQ